jgi:hypothetical protein
MLGLVTKRLKWTYFWRSELGLVTNGDPIDQKHARVSDR